MLRKGLIRQLKLFIVVLLGYLLQVSVMPYLAISGVTPSLLFAVIAIVTVGYGKLRAFWVGAFYGIVMETLLPTVKLVNLIFYPVSALLFSILFADRSAAKLQYERSIGKAGRNRNPYLRTVLCAACNVGLFEIINLAYRFLGGTELTWILISRSLTDIIYTCVLTIVIMYPVRKLLGFRRPKPEDPAEMRFHRDADRA